MKLVILFFAGLICASLAEDCNVKNVMVCYYGSWGVYRPGAGKIDVDNIDPKLCTHLVYTFAGLNIIQNAIVSLDPGNDFSPGNDAYKKFINLKEKNKCLKTLIAIGGWNEKSRKYSVMASNPGSLKGFADNALRFITQYEFDGLDFDWEYPGSRGGIETDNESFVALLKELRARFQPWNYMLTVAVAATEAEAQKAYKIKEISDIVDYVHLMAYDYTASNSKTTGLLAPLKNDKDPSASTVDKSVQYWLDQGCDPAKLVLGIPIYARSFKLANEANTDIGAPTEENLLAGKYTREVGFLSTYELLEILDDYDYSLHYKYSNNYATNGTYWFTYDDVKTVKEKVQYVKQRKLAGVMAWSLDTDDFAGLYSDVAYPLLTAMKEELEKA